MEKNKKLRLLVTKECHNNCPKCCNKQYDLDSVPVIDRFDYDEVCITGGEPMLEPNKVAAIAKMFKNVAKCLGKKVKVYVYTALLDHNFLRNTARAGLIDGFVVTPHTKIDIGRFKALNYYLSDPNCFVEVRDMSLRLNLFADVKEQLKDEDLSRWKIKDMEWLDECPVPEGEDFRRIANI